MALSALPELSKSLNPTATGSGMSAIRDAEASGVLVFDDQGMPVVLSDYLFARGFGPDCELACWWEPLGRDRSPTFFVTYKGWCGSCALPPSLASRLVTDPMAREFAERCAFRRIGASIGRQVADGLQAQWKASPEWATALTPVLPSASG
jgi:hypothetical protein